MVTVIAEWGTYGGWAGRRAIGSGADEALDLCNEIEAYPEAGRVLVGFTSESGRFFGIGLGADDSCTFYWESVDPPYFQSRGGASAADRVDYSYDGQHSEFPGTVRIPRSDAQRALLAFIEIDGLPECIGWDET